MEKNAIDGFSGQETKDTNVIILTSKTKTPSSRSSGLTDGVLLFDSQKGAYNAKKNHYRDTFVS